MARLYKAIPGSHALFWTLNKANKFPLGDTYAIKGSSAIEQYCGLLIYFYPGASDFETWTHEC